MRFKKIQDIMNHPWLKDVDMKNVLEKRLIPPFKTDMFQNNFDSSDFENDEEKQILKIEKEKDYGILGNQEIQF